MGKKHKLTKKRIILQPYSMGKLGPIEFKPREPKRYSFQMYVRNNITMIESFNVSGFGRRGLLQLKSLDSIFDEDEEIEQQVDDDMEREDEYVHDMYDDILYPLNVIEDAYLPLTVQANYGFIKDILSDAYPTNIYSSNPNYKENQNGKQRLQPE